MKQPYVVARLKKAPNLYGSGLAFCWDAGRRPIGDGSRAARPAIDPYKSFRGIGEGFGEGKGSPFSKEGAFPPQLLVGTYFELHKMNIELLLWWSRCMSQAITDERFRYSSCQREIGEKGRISAPVWRWNNHMLWQGSKKPRTIKVRGLLFAEMPGDAL